jgi:hypothetical protein
MLSVGPPPPYSRESISSFTLKIFKNPRKILGFIFNSFSSDIYIPVAVDEQNSILCFLHNNSREEKKVKLKKIWYEFFPSG